MTGYLTDPDPETHERGCKGCGQWGTQETMEHEEGCPAMSDKGSGDGN